MRCTSDSGSGLSFGSSLDGTIGGDLSVAFGIMKYVANHEDVSEHLHGLTSVRARRLWLDIICRSNVFAKRDESISAHAQPHKYVMQKREIRKCKSTSSGSRRRIDFKKR